jgi:hypothetical protein
MGLLHGRAGRLTALFGGFRPGQWDAKIDLAEFCGVLERLDADNARAAHSFRDVLHDRGGRGALALSGAGWEHWRVVHVLTRAGLLAVHKKTAFLYGESDAKPHRLWVEDCVLLPSNAWRRRWDYVQVLLLVYISFSVPYRVGFRIAPGRVRHQVPVFIQTCPIPAIIVCVFGHVRWRFVLHDGLAPG